MQIKITGNWKAFDTLTIASFVSQEWSKSKHIFEVICANFS